MRPGCVSFGSACLRVVCVCEELCVLGCLCLEKVFLGREVTLEYVLVFLLRPFPS